MAEASARLGEVLAKACVHTPETPVYANYTAAPYTAAEAGELLEKQVMYPVRWQQTVEKMIADGVDTFVEVGPGKTLSGLIKKTNRTVNVYNVEIAETLQKVVEALRTGE